MRIIAKLRASLASLAGSFGIRFKVTQLAKRLALFFHPKGVQMATTFKKRQKEMKRIDKARMKAERRAQRKLEGPQPADEFDTRIEDLQPLSQVDTAVSTERE
jgi:hypothetical protein